MKMFQRKVGKKQVGSIAEAPKIEYMNIYSKSVKRLNCFAKITGEPDDSCDDDTEFSGDAQAYEKHLAQLLREQGVAGKNSGSRYSQNPYSFGEYAGAPNEPYY
jgi:hypothetical protein